MNAKENFDYWTEIFLKLSAFDLTQYEKILLLDNDIYVRLVQVCQFVYPSPLPLVRAILDLYNEEWAKLFDQNPYAFLRAIRESNAYCKQSYTNRSYRKPKITSQRMNVMPSVIEEHE